MPRPRPMTRTRKEELTNGQKSQLCHGHDFFDNGFGQQPDYDLMRELWFKHEAEIREHCRIYYRHRNRLWAEEMFGNGEPVEVKRATS